MINRLRAIRKQAGMTLADVAAACDPPTTPQTVGRIETGTRTLSTDWMERLGKALHVEPASLVRAEATEPVFVIAALGIGGAEPLPSPREAIPPSELTASSAMVCLQVDASQGEFRTGDQVWMRRSPADEAAAFLNRDVLAPRPGGRFAFGRLIDRRESLIGILPPGPGQKQIVVDSPPWIAVAAMLVRKL